MREKSPSDLDKIEIHQQALAHANVNHPGDPVASCTLLRRASVQSLPKASRAGEVSSPFRTWQLQLMRPVKGTLV